MINNYNLQNSRKYSDVTTPFKEQIEHTANEEHRNVFKDGAEKKNYQNIFEEASIPVVPPRKRSNAKTSNMKRALSQNNLINGNSTSDITNSNFVKDQNGIIKHDSIHILKTNLANEDFKLKEFYTNDSTFATNYQMVRIGADNQSDMKTGNISIVNNYTSNEVSKQPSIKTDSSKTIVQITSPPVKTTPTIHRLQIRNEFPDNLNVTSISSADLPQRKTSILINGDDCYQTVNVNDDIPIYQSSVVVNDSNSTTVGINYGGSKSSVYITGNFQVNGTNVDIPESHKEKESTSKKTLVILNDNVEELEVEELNEKPAVEVEEFKEERVELKKEVIPEDKTELIAEKPSSDELQKLLNDPVEAVKRNLVPHVCGKADIEGKSKSQLSSNSLVARLLEDPFLGSLAEGLEAETVAKLIENSLIKLQNQSSLIDDDKDLGSESESIPAYELVEAGSDCYSNHSNRSSVAEDELSTRSKFYQLLADAASAEIEEHHYECIRPTSDPIYEEIEIPPPLPTSPPPSSMTDDLKLDKQFTTR